MTKTLYSTLISDLLEMLDRVPVLKNRPKDEIQIVLTTFKRAREREDLKDLHPRLEAAMTRLREAVGN